jgi:hypothetical protein
MLVTPFLLQAYKSGEKAERMERNSSRLYATYLSHQQRHLSMTRRDAA